MKHPIKIKWLSLSVMAICASFYSSNAQASAQPPMEYLVMAPSIILVLPDSAVDAKETRFLEHAAEISLREIKLGDHASLNSKNVEVQALAKKMSQEHSASLKKLNILASKKLVLVPSSSADKDQEKFKELSGKIGNDYDMEYCDMVVDGHKKAITVYEKMIEDTKDPEILVYAKTELIALNGHLRMAEKCKESCSKTDSGKSR